MRRIYGLQHINTFTLWLVVMATCIASGCSKSRNSVSISDTPITQIEEAKLIAGKAAYDTHCSACHMSDGSGAPPMNPPLIKTSFVLGESDQLIVIILNGMKGVEVDGERYKNVMPGLPHLTDQEIADLLTYVRNSFGNRAGPVSADSVAINRSLYRPQ